jgi:DNA processing protein
VKKLEASTILALLSLPRFGRKTVRTLLLQLRDEDATSLAPNDLPAFLAACAPSHNYDLTTIDRALATATKAMREAQHIGITALTMFDEGFPSQLREIPDPPILLFVKGGATPLYNKPAVAVIGTREPTGYGERCAQKLGKRFAERGFVVVSGLAKGCDALAHIGCLEGGGVGVAVMAHGLDTVYPAENRPLAEKLLAAGGCLISEYPPGTRAHRSHFVERDRLQSGLSRGVVVVETDVKGGTMHTVGFAQAQHRYLACVSHPQNYLHEPKVQGNQHLLKTGAALPLADADDLDRFASTLLGDKSAASTTDNVASERSKKNGQGSLW